MGNYVATVYLMIEADSEAEACDCVSESLRSMPDSFPDWGYATLRKPIKSSSLIDQPGGYQYHARPVEIEFPEGHDYQEGDFLEQVPIAYRLKRAPHAKLSESSTVGRRRIRNEDWQKPARPEKE